MKLAAIALDYDGTIAVARALEEIDRWRRHYAGEQ
jgi:hypothetical protein